MYSVRHVKHAARGPHVKCGPHDNTMSPIWPSGDLQFDMPGLDICPATTGAHIQVYGRA
jgi:hypothetical protein